MKDILKITASLTIVCVAAAFILGFVNKVTDHARKETEEKMETQTRMRLLGYGEDKKIPENLKVYAIYRYVITKGDQTTLGYIVPLKDKKHALVQVDLSGKALKTFPINEDDAKLAEKGPRDAAVNQVLGSEGKGTYAETFYIANLGAERVGYVAPSVTQGFKTAVRFMVGFDPKFSIKGIAITKHEEDPGLGEEITKDYFRNQFVGKTADGLKDLAVIKEPLPEDYLVALEPAKAQKLGKTEKELTAIKEKHAKDQIYALTGATISSRAVTNGVKEATRKFVYRLGILSDAVKSRNVETAF
jgi:electron transport complex protein RnfG